MHRAYTGNGLVRLVVNPLCERIKNENRNAFLMSDNPAILHIARSNGWEKADEGLEHQILTRIAREKDGSPRIKKQESEMWVWVS